MLFAAGLYFGFELAKPPPPPDFDALREPAPGSEPLRTPPPPRASRPAPPASARPRVSIVIDDLGRSLEELDALTALKAPLTYSVLPYETRTPQVVAELERRGAEFLCHLPMEAKGGGDPGPGALRVAMRRKELRAATLRALAAVPGAAGVNNHMGSGLMAERRAVKTLLEVLAERRLYFLDSRTSADTLGFALARRLGVPAGERQVFLDIERDEAFIRAQFGQLLEIARQRGQAVAIGHPHPETLKVLAAEIPRAQAEGFEFVTAGALMNG